MNTIPVDSQEWVMYGAVCIGRGAAAGACVRHWSSWGKRNFWHPCRLLKSERQNRAFFPIRRSMKSRKGLWRWAKVKTGALIVIQQNEIPTEYERTGIEVDGIITSQLLINIFELLHRFTTVLLFNARRSDYLRNLLPSAVR